MPSPARYINGSEKSVGAFSNRSDARFKVEGPIARATNGLTAFSFEFVAKPDKAASAPLILPVAVQSGLEDIAGFAGSLVLISDQEARLITVIIFWSGTEVRRSCERGVRRVRAFLAPYMDRCLREQNLLAHTPKPRNPETEASSIDIHFNAEESIAEEANVCLA